MKKKLGLIRLQIISGKANPSPPIGPALGQKGLNITEFCKNFNTKTQSINPSILLPVLIKFYDDKSYDFLIKNPSTSVLIKNLLKIDKEANKSKINNILSITIDDIKEIANLKLNDFNTNNIYSSVKIIIGVVKSMGININY